MKTEEQEEILTEEIKTKAYNLILYNDDFNTFDHVIGCLISICKHSVEQAEQCTYLVHYKGKCKVKAGSLNQLKPMLEGLTSQGLTAEIK